MIKKKCIKDKWAGVISHFEVELGSGPKTKNGSPDYVLSCPDTYQVVFCQAKCCRQFWFAKSLLPVNLDSINCNSLGICAKRQNSQVARIAQPYSLAPPLVFLSPRPEYLVFQYCQFSVCFMEVAMMFFFVFCPHRPFPFPKERTNLPEFGEGEGLGGRGGSS